MRSTPKGRQNTGRRINEIKWYSPPVKWPVGCNIGKISFLCDRVSYYFLIKILILIRKASPDGAAGFVIYKERNHKTSLI